jgi:hypothetical protein
MCVVIANSPAASPKEIRAPQDAPAAKTKEKKTKRRPMVWAPPNVDAVVRGLANDPACRVSEVLERAGARVTDMVANLQNFTASEKIEYELLDNNGALQDSGDGTFDYLVAFDTTARLSVQETRTPSRDSYAFPASSEDKGLPEMALIFLPRLQRDYEMTCEGMAMYNGRAAWVVAFHQRADKPAETLSFSSPTNSIYQARLKGRAWIAEDSGEVMHLETSLMEAIPMMQVRDWTISIDYAPVKFHTQDVTIWLPQKVDGYCQLDTKRRIVYHDFSDFQLFSVQTKQVIDKPQN